MPKKKKDSPVAPEVDLKELKVWASATPYTVGQWRGRPHYKCALCPFDTLNEDAIFDHIASHQLARKSITQSVASTLEPEQTGKADMFELELEEVSNFTDEAGTEHKKFTVKE